MSLVEAATPSPVELAPRALGASGRLSCVPRSVCPRAGGQEDAARVCGLLLPPLQPITDASPRRQVNTPAARTKRRACERLSTFAPRRYKLFRGGGPNDGCFSCEPPPVLLRRRSTRRGSGRCRRRRPRRQSRPP